MKTRYRRPGLEMLESRTTLSLASGLGSELADPRALRPLSTGEIRQPAFRDSTRLMVSRQAIPRDHPGLPPRVQRIAQHLARLDQKVQSQEQGHVHPDLAGTFPTTLFVSRTGVLYQSNAQGFSYVTNGVIAADPAFLPFNQGGGQTDLITFQGGNLEQYVYGHVYHVASGVRSASLTFSPSGVAIYDVVFQNGNLYEFQGIQGAKPILLAQRVVSASLAFNALGQPVRDIVFDGGVLYQYTASGVTRIGSGFLSASIAYDSDFRPNYAMVFENGSLYLYRPTGLLTLSNTAQFAGLTF